MTDTKSSATRAPALLYQDFSQEFEYIPERQCNYNARLDTVELTLEARVHYDRWCSHFELPVIPDGLALHQFMQEATRLLAVSLAYKKWLEGDTETSEISQAPAASEPLVESEASATNTTTAQILQFRSPKKPFDKK